ncbi:alpha/beta hydrolase [Phaeobacter sp. J2-8]|uniref:alpha/beta fold hydrolase n=1 Tax=Phaeobacter sp. J2-8 TaxID=2931394 RepID=UPI001FD3DA44|nr:alpha/beta hydrolase [Phaeobacter sp. J2-8]MCJ7874632.1 alpha/beta hydrolase [Phaeobacter sp. J2-8]
MTLLPAPYFNDIARGPDNGQCYWLTTDDGKRIRIGHWPAVGTAEGKPLGTYLIFPGRTEYVEKYGPLAKNLTAVGYEVIAIDWRGQGLSDRMLADERVGHVDVFADYQRDVQAVLAALPKLGAPKPLYLLGHSMGGCIGLRALHNKIPVIAAVFTGPMWGIRISTPVRPAAWAVGWTSKILGLSHHYAPSTGADSYVATAPFEDNLLTTDRDMFDFMRDQVVTHPELQLGGPSLHWLHEALRECRQLAAMPSPDLPCLTFIGSNERIVSVPDIQTRMSNWPGGKLEVLENGEHEVLMEAREMRARIFELTCAHFHAAFEQENQVRVTA